MKYLTSELNDLERSMGFQPMTEHGQDGHATDGRATTDAPLRIRQGAYLPHWTRDGAIYAINFRLTDSLPQHVLQSWRFERDDIVQRALKLGRPITAWEEKRLNELFSQRVEQYLDTGIGECWMRRDEIAEVIAQALRFFENTRYRLWAWCVMPNHVHVVAEPFPDNELPAILHSWKSFTSNRANRMLGRQGPFWQPESYDHLIRDEDDFWNQVQYVLDNPRKAGLMNWKWVGGMSGLTTACVAWASSP